MLDFIRRHAASVIGVLSGLDRIRFRGTLRGLVRRGGMWMYLRSLGLRLGDFKERAEVLTDQLCHATEQLAERSGRPYQYLNSPSQRKEPIARRIAEQDGISQGLICILGCVEPCTAFRIQTDSRTGYPDFRLGLRRCLHYYHYFLHPQLGFMHVRIQTWLPFSIHVCLNGRLWLKQQMDRAGLAYQQRDNTFLALDVQRAQAFLDSQVATSWPRLLDGLVKRVKPLHERAFKTYPVNYYWTVDESEWATDVMFRSQADLSVLYPRLVRHGMEYFNSREVMRFLERRVPKQGGVHGNFSGEVLSDVALRGEGLRIRHRLNANSIKMYNKGSVLRVETTLNDAADLKVYRRVEGDNSGPKQWRRLRKGVADLHRRIELSQRANERYLDGLAATASGQTLAELVDPLCQAVTWKGRRMRALNPLAAGDLRLLQAIGQGEYLIQGLRNRDLRQALYGPGSDNAQENRRRSCAVTRKLRLLRAHRLIHKVPRTQRYLISPRGQAVLAALLAARQADADKLAEVA